MIVVMAAARILVSGHVQGVGFRYRTAGEARRLGLTGSAVNRPDGTVEVTAFGARADIESLVAWVSGPAAPGRVDDLEVAWSSDDPPPSPTFTTG
jgi:acylphosphatase